MFSENDLSFYVADDIDYREMNIHIGIEDTSDYYLKAQKNIENAYFTLHLTEIGILRRKKSLVIDI